MINVNDVECVLMGVQDPGIELPQEYFCPDSYWWTGSWLDDLVWDPTSAINLYDAQKVIRQRRE